MRLVHLVILLGSLTGMASAADVVPVVPPPIRFPDLPAPTPPPPPKPDPAAVPMLAVGSIYVIDSDVDVMVEAFPEGVVKITEDAGPIKIAGTFIGGSTRETRTYKGKSVTSIEPTGTGTGRVVLVVIPAGAKSKADWIRRAIDVGSPSPEPDPKPAPPASTLSADLSNAYKLETDEEKPLVPALATLYRDAVASVDTSATWGDLFSAMAKDATDKGVSGKLAAIQAAIRKELRTSLPWKGAGSQAIDVDGKTKAKAAFGRVADALAALK